MAVEEAILRAREQLREGPHVIGWALGIAASTVHAVLAPPRPLPARRPGRRRVRSSATSIRTGRADPRRHQEAGPDRDTGPPGHRRPLEARPKGKAGWQYLFVAIDDCSRLGFAAVYPDDTSDSAIAFLDELVRFYDRHGIPVERVLTDNGSCFKRRWADACAATRSRSRKPAPYRPQTNGKAERFIRTLLERWAYAYPYEHEIRPPRGPRPRARLLQSLPSPPRPRQASRRYSASTTSLGHTASRGDASRLTRLHTL